MIRKILVVSLLMIVFIIFACGKQELTAAELAQSEVPVLEGPPDQQTGRPRSTFGRIRTLWCLIPGPRRSCHLSCDRPDDGAATTIGPIGFERVGGMDFHPVTGVLYAAGERADGSNTPVLITIDVTPPGRVLK